ncbi:MAG TPA: hypothetical protein VEY95_00775 [Azospirillaceae bacterium]|nr:hypothetical protein [Azospirillaceae bacterium]
MDTPAHRPPPPPTDPDEALDQLLALFAAEAEFGNTDPYAVVSANYGTGPSASTRLAGVEAAVAGLEAQGPDALHDRVRRRANLWFPNGDEAAAWLRDVVAAFRRHIADGQNGSSSVSQ